MGSEPGRRAVLSGLVLEVALCSCSVPSDRPLSPALTESPAALPAVQCTSSVRTGPLPEWARDDFSDDGSSFRHVDGLHGLVVGVLFGYPLSAPPRASRENKILWVARDHAAARLEISAQLEGSGPVVAREVGFGGGQSIIDLPRSGCWRLTLHWGDQLTDVVDVPYVGRPR